MLGNREYKIVLCYYFYYAINLDLTFIIQQRQRENTKSVHTIQGRKRCGLGVRTSSHGTCKMFS